MRISTKTSAKSSQKPHKQSKQLTPAQLASGLIISVSEARKIMGADAKDYTDDELIMHIFNMTQLSTELLNTSYLFNKQL